MSVPTRYPIRGGSASELVASVERGIRDARLAPGTPLPTVRGLARQLGLSPTTVAAAYRALRLRGLVTSGGRRGTRVGPRPAVGIRRPAEPPAGLRDLATGNPDPRLLPPLAAALAAAAARPRLYGEPAEDAELLRLAAADFEADGIDAAALAVVGGALDGLERVLQSQLRAGDSVAVEDPGYSAVLDLVAALGLEAVGVAIDDSGPLPAALRAALDRGCRALIVTPRAQNPTGAALDERRARELRGVLAGFPEILVVEDDHAGPVAGAPALTLTRGLSRWAVVRSVSKSLGPDLRLSLLAGDAETVARVQGRQYIGAGWVSHILQGVVVRLWNDPATARRMKEAARVYAERRRELVAALARRGIEAFGRSGLNVWIPVAEEASVVTSLAAAGWSARAGERYRIRSGPAVRVTVASLRAGEAERVAADLAAALRPPRSTASA